MARKPNGTTVDANFSGAAGNPRVAWGGQSLIRLYVPRNLFPDTAVVLGQE